MEDSLETGTGEWAPFMQLFKRQEVPAKTILLREGAISKKAFFIQKGCIRLYFDRDGREITFQFFFEGEGVSSIESFKSGKPSLFTIETLEPCIISTITKKDFQFVLDHSAAIKQQVEESIFERLVVYQKLFLSRLKNNPEKRYRELLAENPKILQRVPQHYIASFLGITSVSLSRIRNRK